jgi:hypothetical protein
MACLEDKLYIALGGGYIVSYDLGTSRTRLIVSSRRIEKQSPFDNSYEDPFVPCMAADPVHQRVIFLSRNPTGVPFNPDKCGVWTIDSNDHVEQLIRPRTPDTDDRGMWPEIIRSYYDLRSEMMFPKTNSLIGFIGMVGRDRELYPPQFNSLLSAIDGQPGPDGRIVDETHRWIWSARLKRGTAWGRYSVDKKRIEIFPDLRKSAFDQFDFFIQFIEHGKYALVGGDRSLWLLTLKREEATQSSKD